LYRFARVLGGPLATARSNDTVSAVKNTELEILEIAVNAARVGGELVLSYYESRALLSYEEKDTGKNGAADLVSIADSSVEEAIKSSIAQTRPSDSYLGEESGLSGVRGDIQWVIDPIDGTLNFAYGRGGFAVSVAAVDECGTLAGVVFDPVSGRMYRAARGGGAYSGSSRLLIENKTQLSRCLVEVGAGRGETRTRFPDVLKKLFPLVRDVRRGGSAALALAAHAAGESDAVYGPGLDLWDRAAGILIAREAGSRVENLYGAEPDDFMTLAAHPAVFEELRAVIMNVLDDMGGVR
jgi:myo-inositol-1(or 4)-monophosphatase